jgi:hypothetical protein
MGAVIPLRHIDNLIKSFAPTPERFRHWANGSSHTVGLGAKIAATTV